MPSDELASTRPVSVAPEDPPVHVLIADPPPVQQQPARPRSKAGLLVAALVVVGGLAGAGVFVMRSQGQGGSSGAQANQSTATLELHSRPEGASIFVDGRPTGLKTPATISGLPVGRTLKLRIDADGYLPVSRETTPTSGPSETLSFTLEPAPGRSDK
jgi:hypothetical protein